MPHTRKATARPLCRLLVVLLLLSGLVWAQRPLAEYAPAESVVSLDLTRQSLDFGSLGDALAALDWSRLGGLIERSAAQIDDRDIREMLEMFGDLQRMNHDLSELDSVCQGLSEPLGQLIDRHFLDEALLTVSLSPFDPIPAVSAFARVDEDSLASASAVQEALANCFASTSFEQDGSNIYLLADGSDLPLLLASMGDVFMVSTDPEVLRAAVRQGNGSSEASLADTALWQAGSRLESGGLGFAFDLTVIAAALENLAGFIDGGSEEEAVARRLLAALRTVGGYAGRLGLSDDGIRFESLIAVDRDGGDPDLAELLLCRACTVSRPFLAPAGMTGIESQYLPLRELFSYLQSWLDIIGPAFGEELDLERLLRDEAGIDLGTALLDWVGAQIHTVRLEPFAPDLPTLLYNPQVAYIVPVASAEQARSGLAEIGRALQPIASELLNSRNMMGALSEISPMPGIGSGIAVRDTSYRGITITRIQAGFNVDIGYALIGNNLVIGTPAAAVEPLIDTFEGAPNLLSNSGYMAMTENAPSSVRALYYQDHSGDLEGVHTLLSSLVQPLAALIDIGISSMTGDAFGGRSNFDGGGFADLFGLTPTRLEIAPGGVAVGGDLSPGDEDNYGAFSDYFELLGLEPGDSVTVTVNSSSFDTYLYLIDADSEQIIDSDDDTPDTSRSELVFTVEPGVPYWVEVASYGGNEVGAYRLEVIVERSGTPAATTPPSFREILEALEVLPAAVAVLADHVDSSEGYMRVEGDTLYMRQLTRIRW